MNPSTPPPDAGYDLAAIVTWLWVIGLSLLGGFVSFIQKLKMGHVRAWNLTEFVGELATSAFVGILTFKACTWLRWDPSLTAALVGITSHMGSRALFKAEAKLSAWSDMRFPTQKEPTNGAG